MDSSIVTPRLSNTNTMVYLTCQIVMSIMGISSNLSKACLSDSALFDYLGKTNVWEHFNWTYMITDIFFFTDIDLHMSLHHKLSFCPLSSTLRHVSHWAFTANILWVYEWSKYFFFNLKKNAFS